MFVFINHVFLFACPVDHVDSLIVNMLQYSYMLRALDLHH